MFKKIAAAIAFSPRMEAILFEAKRLQQLFGAELILMHIGERNEEKRVKLAEAMAGTGLDGLKTQTFWEEGDPAKKIIKLCKEQQVELLLAGALRKENLFTYYTGSVARSILRKAPCSVLVLVEPGSQPSGFERIVIHAGDEGDSLHTICTGCYIGKRNNASSCMW